MSPPHGAVQPPHENRGPTLLHAHTMFGGVKVCQLSQGSVSAADGETRLGGGVDRGASERKEGRGGFVSPHTAEEL